MGDPLLWLDSADIPSKWGSGIVQTANEYNIIKALDEEAGFRELAAKVSATKNKAPIDCNGVLRPASRFSIFADFCFGDESIEVSRKYLRRGVLENLSKKYLAKLKTHAIQGEPALRLALLIAGALSLGVDLPPEAPITLRLLVNMSESITTLAREQTAGALDRYKIGEPYDFGNRTLFEAIAAAQATKAGLNVGEVTTMEHAGPIKYIEVRDAEYDANEENPVQTLTYAVAPATDEELGFPVCYAYDVCGAFG